MDNQSQGSTCAFCNDALIGEKRSKEHVIPNSIGGWLKTSDFICKECNTTKGESWDSELAKQLNWFGLVLGISRERGSPSGLLVNTVDGKEYKLLADGSFIPKSSYSEELVDGKKRIHMVSTSLPDAIKRLNGIAKKHPTFDLQKALADLKIDTSYLDSPVRVEFALGGGQAGRSLVKTALAFASYSGVSPKDFGQALDYLLSTSAPPPYGHAYLSDLVIRRSNGLLFHCVSIKGEPSKHRLWAYIEYYGLFRVIVLINDAYGGPPLDATYAINPITAEEVPVLVSSQISNEELLTIVSGNGIDPVVHRAAIDFAMPIIMERNEQRALESIVREGFVYAAEKLGIPEGAIIPTEMAAEFTRLMMEKISIYIEHRVRRSH